MTNPTPLPALPEPGVNIPAGDWTNITDSRYYTDTQMRTYAESAIAALGSSMPSGEALTSLVEAAFGVMDNAPCECGYRRRDFGQHLSGCFLFDLGCALDPYIPRSSPPPSLSEKLPKESK